MVPSPHITNLQQAQHQKYLCPYQQQPSTQKLNEIHPIRVGKTEQHTAAGEMAEELEVTPLWSMTGSDSSIDDDEPLADLLNQKTPGAAPKAPKRRSKGDLNQDCKKSLENKKEQLRKANEREEALQSRLEESEELVARMLQALDEAEEAAAAATEEDPGPAQAPVMPAAGLASAGRPGCHRGEGPADQLRSLRRALDHHAKMAQKREATLSAEILELKTEMELTKKMELEKTALVEQMKIEIRAKDSEIAQVRREAYGVEVHDVDEGITLVVEVGEAGAEPALKRMRRDQVAGARVTEALQARLVEVKKEKEEEGEARCSELRVSVDAKVREALAQVAEAIECACCFEPLAPGSAVAFNCGHTYCNRANCVSSSQTHCPECRQLVTVRVPLFGALSNVSDALLAHSL